MRILLKLCVEGRSTLHLELDNQSRMASRITTVTNAESEVNLSIQLRHLIVVILNLVLHILAMLCLAS